MSQFNFRTMDEKNPLALGMWSLFGVSIFVSKSGITLFGTVLVLWSLFMFDFKNAPKKNPWILLILSFFPVAIILNLLSVGGSDASLKVIQGWSWPLYVLPFYFLFNNERLLKFFSWSLGGGLFLACAMALLRFGVEFSWKFDSLVRVASFWDIGRWAYLLAASCTVLFALLGEALFNPKSSRGYKFALGILFFLSVVFLILANSRGPWLGAAVGIAVLGVSGRNYFKLSSVLAIAMVAVILAIPGVTDRVKSSFSAKTEKGVITSTDPSNAGRLHMWKVNADFYKENLFFGTGFEMAEKPLREFLAKQHPDYIKAYIDPEFSFRDQHNSYLWILVQMGLVFFLYFWLSVGVIVVQSLKNFFKTKDVLFKMAFALIASQLFMFIFYSAVTSYEMLCFFPFLLVLTNARRPQAS